MAELVSPGVSISVTDESFSTSSGTGTVPLIIIATAQDKASPDGAGIAPGTRAAQAGRLRLVSSQRDLLTTYGNPTFRTSGSTPLHGHELNEYGLLAAQSFLGIANRAFVLRADIDLAELEASATAPVGEVEDGTHWLRIADCRNGLKRWDGNNWVTLGPVVIPQPHDVANNEPKPSFGKNGEFAAVFTNGNGISTLQVFEKVQGQWYLISNDPSSPYQQTGIDKDFQVARHTNLPTTRSDGSSTLLEDDLLWQMNETNFGNQLCTNLYVDGQWVRVPNEGFEHAFQIYDFLEATQGGVQEGDLWKDFDGTEASLVLKRHNGLQTMVVNATSAPQPISVSNTSVVAFEIIVDNSDKKGGQSIEVLIDDSFDLNDDGELDVEEMVAAIASAISAADPETTSAGTLSVRVTDTGLIRFVEGRGRDVELVSGDVDILDLGFTDPDAPSIARTTPYSNWSVLSLLVSISDEPAGDLANGALWYDTRISRDNVDLLWNDPVNGWVTYPFDVNVAASQPQVNSQGNALVLNDIWVDSSDLENYPQVYRWTGSAWSLLDNSDQVSTSGIVFADVRSSTLALDADAPNPVLFPFFMIVWNKRLSGGNVKEWNAVEQRWEDYSGNKPDGSPYMLRKAQRRAVVRKLQAAVSSSEEIRNESNRFNLIAAPGYPELLDEMIELNTDRKETAFIIADAPLRLSADASSLQAWATNAGGALENGEDGLLSSSPYAAVYYPHGFTSNLDGNNVVVPASHIALRTIAFNDQVAFPWFAPAGFQRGVVTNATSVGFIDGSTGEFRQVALSEGQRDVLYINKINPVATFPGRGLSIFGQKTLNPVASALDRVNVARLVVFIRERLDDLVKPFLFEPNDEVTRQNAKTLVDRFLGNLVTQRGLFDFVVVCDSSNNTPDRIDRNELHIDIAIQPIKAVEFIYIPIRVQNTLGQSN